MSIKLENMTAVQNEQQGGILGHLMWFSVGKQLVKMDDLERGLVQSGLPVEWMPNAIRPADAFRRSTKEIETRKSTGHVGVFENFLIREVFSDKSHVQRNIVVEKVDQAGKRLEYNSKAGVITLDKQKSSLTFITENEIAKELCFEAERNFSIYKDHYSAQQIRVMVSKILQSLALMSIARKQKRDFCLILFSTRTKIFKCERGKIKNVNMINLARIFLGGGTDFALPLERAMNVINESRFKQADLVFITDGEDKVKDSFLESFNKKKKEKNCNVLSLTIGSNIKTVNQFSDKVVQVKDFDDVGSFTTFEI